MGPFLQPLVWGLMVLGWDRFPPSASSWLAIATGLAVFVGAGLACAHLESQVKERRISTMDWLRGWAVFVLFFHTPFVAFAVFLSWAPGRFDATVAWLVLAASSSSARREV